MIENEFGEGLDVESLIARDGLAADRRAGTGVGGDADELAQAVLRSKLLTFGGLPLFALEVVLLLAQTQAAIASPPLVWLLTPGSPEHMGSWGLARSTRAEAPVVSRRRPRRRRVLWGSPARGRLERAL